jgi:hypothetical protein
VGTLILRLYPVRGQDEEEVPQQTATTVPAPTPA